MVKDVSIIIGANYGDEGKGRMSDYLANKAIQAGQSTITILSNGGAQRGHTVVLDNGFTHIFHHFGSGTLDAKSIWNTLDFEPTKIIRDNNV